MKESKSAQKCLWALVGSWCPWPPAAAIAAPFGRNEKNPGGLQEHDKAADEILA